MIGSLMQIKKTFATAIILMINRLILILLGFISYYLPNEYSFIETPFLLTYRSWMVIPLTFLKSLIREWQHMIPLFIASIMVTLPLNSISYNFLFCPLSFSMLIGLLVSKSMVSCMIFKIEKICFAFRTYDS